MTKQQSYILFIFEGERTEPHIVRSLEKFFLNERENLVVKAIFGTTIYTLYEKFLCFGEFDEDLDTFTLAQEMSHELHGLNSEQIAEIYLFFDYDGHASNASEETLKNILEKFDNETEKGKLYISYPMVEAIKHLNGNVSFQDTNAESDSRYKVIVHEEAAGDYKDFRKYTEATWHFVIQQHAKKANYLIEGSFSYPIQRFEQKLIFTAQNDLHRATKEVAVLSGFPLFLLDYYGVEKFSE